MILNLLNALDTLSPTKKKSTLSLAHNFKTLIISITNIKRVKNSITAIKESICLIFYDVYKYK